jgi:hypothetical protein
LAPNSPRRPSLVPDLPDRLQAALGATYRIERELGGGGMSRVFVAVEADLGRKVVIKVLPPEMGVGVNAERFRREIQMAASLQHPHIVPLLHAGRADDLVWYTMPLIEGQSLRGKLAREGELPISETVRILRDVADALSHAHAHGVVHRDIKPDNVLLSGHHAVVTDFGVAKAVSAATGEAAITSMGVALGTPAYMAPEQATADPHVDHRADIYALGALAYEMLSGRPPFVGSTVQQVLAAHVTETPDPVTQHRAAVPPALAGLVMRCLEKKPADRWQSAAEVHQQLEGMATPSGGTTPTVASPATPAASRRWARLGTPALAAMVALLVAVAAFAVWRLTRGAAGPPLDQDVVAVLPFRVEGSDPALHYLREGMIDLLAAKFTGEGGPRAADPRTATSAWRSATGKGDQDADQRTALAVARRIGAGQVILGSVVGAPGHLVLNARLLAVPGGATRAQANVEGPADSLPPLVDRLTAQLLVGGAAGNLRVASLTTTSLEGLRAYLAGQVAYRNGEYDAAIADLGRAIAADSSFVLAASAYTITAGWLQPPPPNAPRVERLAWEGRDRLSTRDRTLLEAFVGPAYPALSNEADILAAREKAVEIVPDQADAWYFLGDEYFHNGQYLGYADWQDRAQAAFQRAVALDSTFAGPLSHLINLAADRGDSAAARRYGRLYGANVTSRGGGYDLLVRWDWARTLGDSALLRDFWLAFDSSATPPPIAPMYAQIYGGDPATVDSMASVVRRHASSESDRTTSFVQRNMVLMNRGRPHAAFAALDSAGATSNPSGAVIELAEALYQDGDSAVGAAAAHRLARVADAVPAEDAGARFRQYAAGCFLEQWRIAHGNLGTAPRTIARLRAVATPPDSPVAVSNATVCAALLEAMLATTIHRSDALNLVIRADSIMVRGPNTVAGPFAYQNLLLGRLFTTLGEPARGLAAVRRGGYFGAHMLSPYLYAEAQLAALTGDRAGAIRAYQRYLALRQNPEPAVQPIVEAARAELSRLVGETGNR